MQQISRCMCVFLVSVTLSKKVSKQKAAMLDCTKTQKRRQKSRNCSPTRRLSASIGQRVYYTLDSSVARAALQSKSIWGGLYANGRSYGVPTKWGRLFSKSGDRFSKALAVAGSIYSVSQPHPSHKVHGHDIVVYDVSFKDGRNVVQNILEIHVWLYLEKVLPKKSLTQSDKVR